MTGTLNLSNVLQLAIEYPRQFTLHRYHQPAEVAAVMLQWLRDRSKGTDL
jgi:hypothetical protein